MREREAQMIQGSTFSATITYTPDAPRIPDDDLSVCTLHPERTRRARRLIAFLDEREAD
jgi:hypothetical protein